MNTHLPVKTFSELLGIRPDVKVIDIGANPIDGAPPYASMLARGEAHVVGFEPNLQALDKLERLKGTRDVYLPLAAGDGKSHRLHICAAPGMTSLFEPNPEVLELMHGFPNWGSVISTELVNTVRLADIAPAMGADYLKIDIQGAELMVLENAGRALDSIGVIHAEVEFMELYRGQPLFGDVERYLRSAGFSFHRFSPLVSRLIRPLSAGGDIYAGMSQLVWADAIFIRDLRSLGTLPERMLLNMAAILHDCYQSIDIVMHILTVLDRRTGTGLAAQYLDALQGRNNARPNVLAA